MSHAALLAVQAVVLRRCQSALDPMGVSGRPLVDQDLEVVRLVLHRAGRSVKKPFREFGGAREPVPKVFEIQYGHNPTTRQVVMLFNQLTPRIVLTPEDAEHMIEQLRIQVEAVRGSSGKNTK